MPTTGGRKARAGLALALAAALICAGCGANDRGPAPAAPQIGVGGPFHPEPVSAPVARRAPVDGLGCEATPGLQDSAHLEVFASRRTVIVPAGIGIVPPVTARGPYVLSGACSYPLRTHEPTGVIEFDRGTRPTLGQFFDVWGQALSQTRLLGFQAAPAQSVEAFVNGSRWMQDLRLIPVGHHDEIVVEIDGFVAPHRGYRFPAGL